VWRQVLAAEGVLDEAGRHAHRCQAETPAEAGVLLEQAGQDRAEEGAEVDAQVNSEKPASRRGSSGAYSDPTTAVALALSPPEPSATRMSPIATPAIRALRRVRCGQA
jgi:hypothetical protein